jgi:hypothetical protein
MYEYDDKYNFVIKLMIQFGYQKLKGQEYMPYWTIEIFKNNTNCAY